MNELYSEKTTQHPPNTFLETHTIEINQSKLSLLEKNESTDSNNSYQSNLSESSTNHSNPSSNIPTNQNCQSHFQTNKSSLKKSHSDSTKNKSKKCSIKFTLLPRFLDAPVEDRPVLFLMKLKQCRFVFDFRFPDSQLKEKEIKRNHLRDLVGYIKWPCPLLIEDYPAIVEMISSNIFRSTSTSFQAFDPEYDEPSIDPCWPHLVLVYDFFLSFITSKHIDLDVAKSYFNKKFITKLVDLFNNEDPRERNILKTILHRFYARFLVHRGFIRKAINHVFHRFVYELEKHNGISELLEIYGSISNGYSIPLKEEHKNFLIHTLVPFHKASSLSAYSSQLSYCILQFLEKDSSLFQPVIHGILRYWPKSNSYKELLFLNEMESILEIIEEEQFTEVIEPLFYRLTMSVISPHFQVCERTLQLWNNPSIFSLIQIHCNIVLPVVFSVLYSHSTVHWNKTIDELIFSTLKLLMNMDRELFERCKKESKLRNQLTRRHQKEMSNIWVDIVQLAQQNPLFEEISQKKKKSVYASPVMQQLNRRQLNSIDLLKDVSICEYLECSETLQWSDSDTTRYDDFSISSQNSSSVSTNTLDETINDLSDLSINTSIIEE